VAVLEKIFISPDNVDAIFCKVLTPNDDSGRHGVLIPVSAYNMFPEMSGFDPVKPENYTEKIVTLWRDKGDTVRKSSSYKHYHRYPERRITALGSKKLDNAPPDAMILIARHKDDNRVFEIYVFYPNETEYRKIASELSLSQIKPGLYYLDKNWIAHERLKESAALSELLEKFDEIKARGFIKTFRNGPTGVGYTFETLMGIKENNDNWADFKGIEIKTFRSSELKMNRAEKTNLFLKEPCWSDDLPNMAERVRKYGYVDDNGRLALYSTVKIDENSHKLKFSIIPSGDRIDIERQSVSVAFYQYMDIKKRLEEKLNQTAFIAAQNRGSGILEEFHYRMLTYCMNPSVPAFVSLLASGSIMLELRMHIGSSGTVRNHGSAFRVMKNRLPDLFTMVRCLRDSD
jgi:hypothetical protein